jgi:preprotein translocase subunit SecD
MVNVTRLQLWISILVCFFALAFAAPNTLTDGTARSLPGWLPHQKLALGLDLQGGAYLLLEVDMKPVLDEQLRDMRNQLRRTLRDERLRYQDLRLIPRGVSFRVVDVDTLSKARDLANRVARDSSSSEGGIFAARQSFFDVRADGDTVTARLTDAGISALHDRVLDQSMATLRRRVDPEGTREVTIQRQGERGIIVEVPGVSDTAEIKRRLSVLAKMEFYLMHPQVLTPDENAVAPAGFKLVRPSAEERRSYAARGTPVAWFMLRDEPELDGRHLANAQQSYQDGRPVIQFRLDTQGATIFCKITQENVDKPFAIVLDNEVISAPNIRSAICGGSGIIEGGFTVESANRLALLLRAGALPAPLKVLEERTVGATLGADAIEAGVYACIIGFSLVLVYMVASYGLFGAVSIVALLFNLIIVAGVMSLLGATLTLPGIAGLVLSLGMAVDANVLIYERMREEMHAGRTTLSAIDSGFRRAFTAIADSNITTIMAGILLYLFGSGPVRGFGVTLALGISASFFTAIMLTRLQIVYWWRWQKPKMLPI